MKTIINKEIERPGLEIINRYRALVKNYFSPACLVCDAQKRSNALSNGIRPIGQHKAVGVAFTINLDTSDFVDPMPVLRFAKEGDFIVIAAHEDMDTAMWGGMTSNLAKSMNIAGVLVDGATRDIDEIRDLNFPVWARSNVTRPSPTAIHGRYEPIQVNVPVVAGKVVIHPGDIIVADESGVTVVPLKDSLSVIEIAEKQAEKELAVRNRILSGASVQEILDEFGHI